MASRTNPKKLRGKLLIKGYTLRGFAKAHGFSERTVKAAIRGERNGPICRRVLKIINDAA